MTQNSPSTNRAPLSLVALFALSLLVPLQSATAQDRLPAMPGYAQYQEGSRKIREIASTLRTGALSTAWAPDSKSFTFRKDGKIYRYDLATRQAVETERMEEQTDFPRSRFRGGGGVERGRQFSSATSPNEKWKAFTKENNLWISNADGAEPRQITTEGNKQNRLKFAIASWVYGEELGQNTAMWWSPDSKKIAYYGFDEKEVIDYHLTLRTLAIQDTLDSEPYPKAGAPNPKAEIYVYDLETKKIAKMDVRDGKPALDSVVGHYAYNVRWSPDGKELLFNRTNRLQNILEIVAADPSTGKCRLIVREEWLPSWTENNPSITYLQDNKRFIFVSERNGWRNFDLRHLDGRLIAPLTQHSFDVERIVRIDEKAGTLYYMARSGDNHFKAQLHRVGLDGKGDKRLTDPKLHHQVQLAPDGKHFIDIAQTHAIPPATRLIDSQGALIATLATTSLAAFEKAGLSKAELFAYKAADKVTNVYGMLYKPSNFDPAKKYPLLVSVYAGPESEMLSENFQSPQTLAEYGFLVASFDGRGTNWRGKKFKDALYRQCGVVEIDDQAEGVKALRQRPYVDGNRVGIHGTSYGGYSSLMCLLRHPDVFQAASASSSVTDWRNYDSIYTERYMGLPQDNKEGYDAGSAMKYADNLRGRLMLFFGTADNNVHPSNSLQVIGALQRAGKSFEVQVGPDQGHAGLNFARMMEFFIENLVMKTPPSRSGGSSAP